MTTLEIVSVSIEFFDTGHKLHVSGDEAKETMSYSGGLFFDAAQSKGVVLLPEDVVWDNYISGDGVVTIPFAVIDCTPFGDSYTGDKGALAYECSMIGTDDVFSDSFDSLCEIGRKRLNEYNGTFGKENNIVHLLTLWSYSTYQDYEGDHDVNYGFLGVLDTSKLQLCLQHTHEIA